jgi:hypothetical protein
MTSFEQEPVDVRLKKILQIGLVGVGLSGIYVALMEALSLFDSKPPGTDAVYEIIHAVISTSVIFFAFPFYLYKWPPRTVFVKICIIVVLVEVVAAYIIAFAIIYRMLGVVVVKDDAIVYDAATCLYFSMITWTTSGYGEVVPTYGARFWAASEALLAYVVMVGSIAILSMLYRSMLDEKSDEQT